MWLREVRRGSNHACVIFFTGKMEEEEEE